MDIEFPRQVMPKVTALGTVSYQVKVNGEFIWCEISFEALRDHFGGRPTGGSELVDAFDKGRATIESVTRRYLEASGGHPVLLRATDF